MSKSGAGRHNNKGGGGKTPLIRTIDVIGEVRKCDRRLFNWLFKHGKLEKKDYVRIYRPALVRKRIEALSKLGILSVDENGTVRLATTSIPPIERLPVNTDLFDRILKKPYLFYLLYIIIRDYAPAGVKDITEMLNQLTGLNYTYEGVRTAIRRLEQYGVVNTVRDSPCPIKILEPSVNLITEDIEYYIDWMLREEEDKLWRRKRL